MESEDRLRATQMYLHPRHLELLEKWSKEVDRPRAWVVRRLIDQEEARREEKREAA